MISMNPNLMLRQAGQRFFRSAFRNLSTKGPLKMYPVQGGCYCGNISLNIQLSRSPETYRVRKCDCEFCYKHGASYVSDPDGKLEYHIKDTTRFGHFRQDKDGNAEFLHCKNCGVLVGAIYQCPEDGRIIGSINSRVISDGTKPLFGPAIDIKPRLLSKDDKITRWKELWFNNVKLNMTEMLRGGTIE